MMAVAMSAGKGGAGESDGYDMFFILYFVRTTWYYFSSP